MSTVQGAEPRGRHSVFLPRLILLTILFISLFPSLAQPALTRIYAYLYHSPFYRFSGFETVETVICYAVIEVLFTYKFGRNPDLRLDVRGSQQKSASGDGNGRTKAKVPKMRRPSERMGEMLIYAAPLFLMDFSMIKKFANVPVSDIRASGNYAPLPLCFDHRNAATALSSNATDTISSSFLLPTLHNFSTHSPLQLTRALPPPQSHAPTLLRLILELAISLLIYDSLFFLLHLLLHRPPNFIPYLSTYLHQTHAHHHTHSEIHPQITNRLSVFERLSLVLLANFSLNIIKSHVLTRTLFIPLFVYLLVEIHSGLDLEWGYEKILPRGWGAGAGVHARHHRTGKGGLAPFFGWWDGGLRIWDEWRAGGGWVEEGGVRERLKEP